MTLPHSQYTPLATIAQALARRIVEALSCGRPQCPCARARRVGYGLTHCPGHADERPSLAVRVVGDRVVVHCHARCGQEHVIDALRARDLWPSASRETRYVIRDADGTPVAVHVRLDGPDGKRLWWEQPDGSRGLGDLRVADLPLYGIERLGDATEVIVCEGEKAADALVRLGLAAVGTVTGASATPGDAALRPLAGRTVYVWPDADDAGRDHMRRVAERLAALGAREVRWVEWPDAPDGGDAADYVARGASAEDVRRLLERARPWTPDELPSPVPAPDESGRERRRQSQAARLGTLVEELSLEPWHTPDGEPWATIVVGEHREHWPLASRAVRTWLQRAFYERYGELAHHQALADAIDALTGRALFEGEEHPVHVRVAEHAGALYLDLADPQWRAVEITPSGWDVVTNPPVRFRRPRGMQPLLVPTRGGSLERLWRFIRVAEHDRVLILAWIVMALRPRGPYPVLALVGEQGAGKSTTARVLRQLVDPNDADLRSEPREERDLWVAAVNGWVIGLDNVSRLPNWLSDALCRIATGAGFAARTLYANNEETILAAQRPIVLTSIADVVAQPDLLDRTLVVAVPRLLDDEREPEAEFWRALEAERPALLGSLLDCVARALAGEQHVRLRAYPRMADFARWAVAALGDESGEAFLTRYTENRREAGMSALDASPVAAAILDLVGTGGHWSGTAQELLDELDARADDETRRRRERMRAWPKTPRGLAGELRRLAPVLRQHGIAVEFTREGHDRRRAIALTRAEGPAQPSASSASSAGDSNTLPHKELCADGRRTVGGRSRTVADGRRTVADGTEPSNRPHVSTHEIKELGAVRTVADGADGRFLTLRADPPRAQRCPTCGAEMRPLDGDGWECPECWTVYWPPAPAKGGDGR